MISAQNASVARQESSSAASFRLTTTALTGARERPAVGMITVMSVSPRPTGAHSRPRSWLDRAAVLTANFGDPGWTRLLVRRLGEVFPEIPRGRIHVIDQDRSPGSARALEQALGPVTVHAFPRSEPHIAATGHDHAHALNLAVREIDSEYLLLFDSDAHPVSSGLRDRLGPLVERFDAVLAAADAEGDRTHPCFMLFGPAVPRDALRFDAGQLDSGVDTGREIGRQILEAGRSVELLRPEPAFGGRWGTLYLDGTIYHHGSGSFAGSPDPRLRRQAASRRLEGALLRRLALRGRTSLSPREDAFAGAAAALDRAARRLGSTARRVARRDAGPFV
jgi:hypothetical protein